MTKKAAPVKLDAEQAATGDTPLLSGVHLLDPSPPADSRPTAGELRALGYVVDPAALDGQRMNFVQCDTPA
jgi:hypothetical protein